MSVCVPSLLESVMVLDSCVTMCMCVDVCVCVCVCVCVFVCVFVCVCVTFSYRYLDIFQFLLLCTEWMYFNFSLLIKESLQKEAIRSMAMMILTTDTSLVNVHQIRPKCD